MPRLIALCFVLLLSTIPSAAVGQTGDGTGPNLQATVGIDGFVAAGEPAVVSATISSPLLLAGRVRLAGGGISVSRPVEVPAGSEQSYQLIAPPLADGTRLTLELLDADGEVVLDEDIVIRSNADELAVGVAGDGDLAGTLGRIRTMVTDRAVEPLAVGPSLPATAFDALDYLVLLPSAEDRLSEGLDWARTGGRLVVDDGLASRMEVGAEPRPTGVEGVSTHAVGLGVVVVVDSITSRSGEEWASILRPVPLDLGTSPEFGMDPSQNGLIQSASESGNRQVPSLPWLLFAILGFALLVGPVNFIVLSRLGKRDLAWVTIPALALLAVFGFWLAGRQRIAGTTVAHASIVVADGITEARSGVLVAAGTGGSREIAFEEGFEIYPEPAGFLTQASELELVDTATARVELDQLAFAGIGARRSRPGVELPVAELDGDSVAISNESPYHFWAWGIVRGSSSIISDGELAPGESGQIGAPAQANEFGFGFVDAVMNQRQLWEDPERSNGLWALTTVLTTSTERSGLYFVGLTDDYQPDLSIDGAPTEPSGMSMVVVRVEGETGDERSGLARAEVVGTGFVNWVDWASPQRMISTDEMTVAFSLPDPNVSPVFRDGLVFGIAPQRYEAWNWQRGSFAEIEQGAALPGRFMSPDGTVYVRLVGGEQGENQFSPDSLTLEWKA